MSFPSVSGLSFQDPSTQFNNTGFNNQTPFGNTNGSGGDPMSQLLQAIIPLLQMAAQMLGGQGNQGGQGGQSPGGGGSCGGGGTGNVGGPGGTQNPFGGQQSDPMGGLFNSFGELFQAIAPLLQSLGGGGMQPTTNSSNLANQF